MPIQQNSNSPFLLGDTERGSYDYSGLTPDEALVQRSIAQRRQMAKLMMSQGMQQAGKRGGMVGNIYVKASPIEGLAGLGQVGLGGLADYFMAKESADATEEHKKLSDAAIQKYLDATTDVPEVPAVPASKPLRPESFGDSNLEDIINASTPQQRAQPANPGVPFLSLRPLNNAAHGASPMNKVSKTLLDLQIKTPQRLSPEQEKFALRFGEGPQDPYAGGMMGDGSGPAVAGIPYQPGTYTPKEIGPESPGTPGTPGIKRTDGEIQRAMFEAFSFGDPRLNAMIQHDNDRRAKKAEAQLMREDRLARDTQANLDRVAQAETMAGYRSLLQEKMTKGQIELKRTASGDTDPNNKARIEVAEIGAESREKVANMKTGAGRQLSATAQKELIQTDEDLQAGNQAIQSLKAAIAINDKAMGFTGAGVVSSIGRLLPKDVRPEAIDATNELDNIITGSSLAQLKSIFGSMPTEGERKLLIDIQGSSTESATVRKGIYERAIAAIEARMKFNVIKAKSLRDGSYFSEEGSPNIEFSNGGPPNVGGGKTVVKTGTGTKHSKISSDAEYKALPSGSTFVGPDGRTRKKP